MRSAKSAVFRQVHLASGTRYNVWNMQATAKSLLCLLEECFHGDNTKPSDDGPGLLFFYQALLELNRAGNVSTVQELCAKAIARDPASCLFKSVDAALRHARGAKAGCEVRKENAISKHVLVSSAGTRAIKARAGLRLEGRWSGASVVSFGTDLLRTSLLYPNPNCQDGSRR